MIDLEHLLRVPYIDPNHGFDISPDGTRVAFAWNKTGEWEIYELSLSAPSTPQPAPITGSRSLPTSGDTRPTFPSGTDKKSQFQFSGAKFAPKYSPSGTRLAYVVDFDGGENFHLCVYDFGTGKHNDLMPDIDFALQPNFCWSPDGTEIAFIANRSGNFDAYIMPSTGGAARCALATQHPAWDVHWSPDGSWLAVTFESKGQDYGIHLVSIDGDKTFLLADESGLLNAHNPVWSPDSKKLAFHSDSMNGFHQIGLFDLPSREITWLTEGQDNLHTPAWSKDGSMLVCVRAQGTSDEISIRKVVDPPADQELEFSVELGVHYKPRFTPDGKHVIFIFNNPRFPPDLWKLTLENGTLTQLMYSLPDEMDDEPYILPEEISYPALDGTPIPALLFKSREASADAPAVVVVHGGPNWHYQMEWFPFMIHLASRGWTVLAPNYRGSTGYGRDWQYANRLDLGGIDTNDVAAGARFLIHEKLANPSKIAITGRSHGGYLTFTCLTQFPDLWAVGSGVVPFTNWFACHERSRRDLQHWDIEMMGDPVQNQDLWQKRSPYFTLEQVHAPVQLICGAHDPRCPAEDSIETRDRLMELGKQVEFHLYEDEGHTFLKTANIIRSEVQRVGFLARHLDP
jgi:dipeptidyl aminopeptidase/acylaminoacyl peptidase